MFLRNKELQDTILRIEFAVILISNIWSLPLLHKSYLLSFKMNG